MEYMSKRDPFILYNSTCNIPMLLVGKKKKPPKMYRYRFVQDVSVINKMWSTISHWSQSQISFYSPYYLNPSTLVLCTCAISFYYPSKSQQSIFICLIMRKSTTCQVYYTAMIYRSPLLLLSVKTERL